MTSLTWTTSTGAAIEITAGLGSDSGRPELTARVDGKVIGIHSDLSRVRPVVVSGQTIVASLGQIGLTAERAEAVRALRATAVAAYGETPMGLTERRATLVSALAAIRAESDRSARSRVTAASGNGIDRGGRGPSAREAAAAEALEAFDAAHPEVLAEIRAERANRYVD